MRGKKDRSLGHARSGAVTSKPASPIGVAIEDPAASRAIADISGLAAITQIDDETIDDERQLYLDAFEEHFGREQLAELQDLARQAKAQGTRGGGRVLILPGIMGSKLGYPVDISPLDDVIWLNPLAIAQGRLSQLNLSSGGTGKPIKALGVLLYTYLSLKLRLRIAGFDADFHPYDWRMSLPELGKDLADRIVSEQREVSIVAHSMGGLVTRACFAHQPTKLKRVVMLGTPNFGSYAPVQAFRGKNGTVEKVALLDLKHSSAELSRIFATFPGLLEMIPAPSPVPQIDLFDPAKWPVQGEKPSAAALAAAKAAQSTLPLSGKGVDMIVVAGVNEPTVVDAQLDRVTDELVYMVSDDGDGTVPLNRCVLNEARTYYVEGEHGSLPGHREIQRALPELLTTGQTSGLSSTRPARRSRGGPTFVREAELGMRVARRGAGIAASDVGGIQRLVSEQLLVSEFALPASPQDELAAHSQRIDTGTDTADAAHAAQFDPALSNTVVYSQGRAFRLEIILARGSITAVEAQCYVLGLFKSVAPTGPARAINAVMNGAVADFVSRRMFNGNLGEVTILPNGRHPMRASHVAFVGLGAIDGFKPPQLEIVGENLIRTFVAGRVDDFAIVPVGGGSGIETADAVYHLLAGFMRGLRDADTKRRFRTITICENNPARYAEIYECVRRLASEELFEGGELTLSYTALPVTIAPTTDPRQPTRADPVYLIVREGAGRVDDNQPGGAAIAKTPALVASVLTSGSQATIISGKQPGGVQDLDDQLAKLEGLTSSADIGNVGREIGKFVLESEVGKLLAASSNEHLVIVHDAEASRIPWEAIPFESGTGAAPAKAAFPALGKGISHRYEASNLSVAKWLERRHLGRELSILIVADPLGTAAKADLKAALDEGNVLKELVRNIWGLECKSLIQEQASKADIKQCLQSGKYDVIHYAGHAFFDPVDPGRSGIICAGGEILSGEDLATIGNLPSLMFVNACEAARIRSYKPDGTRQVTSGKNASRHEAARRSIGFAEALLRGGVANYIGTYWPVDDNAAGICAQIVYPLLLEGKTINQALCKARNDLYDKNHADWANYVFYGDPDFKLKDPSRDA